MKPAALILGYQRYEGVIRAVETLASAGIEKVYLSLDGPKSEEEVAVQEKILLHTTELTIKYKMEFRVSLQSENIGLRSAVIAGIDWFFKYEKSGFIIGCTILQKLLAAVINMLMICTTNGIKQP